MSLILETLRLLLRTFCDSDLEPFLAYRNDPLETSANPHVTYIAYSLSRSAWKKGYAGEAVGKLLDYLFRALDLHRIVADCDVNNLASSRLLERLGFRREGHSLESFWLEKESAWGDEYYYALLQREWILR
jgi:RimJ/RimL family protein N-acetyltransferase